MIDGSIAPNPDSGYTNRIHGDDAVGSVCFLVNQALEGHGAGTMLPGQRQRTRQAG